MKAYAFYLRVVVASAVAICFYFTRGFGSVAETFAMALCAVLAGHGAALGVRKLAGPDRKTLVVLGVVVTALAASAVFVALDDAWPRGPVRSMRVDELMAAPDRFVGRELKLHGYLEIGSMQTRVVDRETERVFTLAEQEQSITVRVRGPVPDTLKDRAEVLARGTLRREPAGLVLVATEVMAKCPSTYNTADGPKPAARFR